MAIVGSKSKGGDNKYAKVLDYVTSLDPRSLYEVVGHQEIRLSTVCDGLLTSL